MKRKGAGPLAPPWIRHRSVEACSAVGTEDRKCRQSAGAAQNQTLEKRAGNSVLPLPVFLLKKSFVLRSRLQATGRRR